METENTIPADFRVVTDIIYCEVCHLPIEYCEFSPSKEKCKKWLKENHPELANEADTNTGEEATESKHQTRGGKGMVRDESDKKKNKVTKVTIKRCERTKRKHQIIVTGLDQYEIELKKAAKLFSSRFACGSSVTKNAAGQEEIVVQGDVQEEIKELILKNYSNVPAEVIELTEDKKSKKSSQQAQAQQAQQGKKKK
ncbi:translation machinery-associated protein 22 [Anaeromyces robustus]|uniref:Translation machinery-associated protein 22 n=1 Tax=Anaeromyces robustus TaxID=1754192 RepID=A0A1Y1XI17_9FUNG|nr:translation machinery-associated protein 22 [Anaeromyces robustus]|eukprot:ORX85383.1 translation machinery-associated protein 22 [Anaeromyces robustus]